MAWCPAQVGWPKIGPEYTFSRCIFWRVPLSRHQIDFNASTTLHARFSGVFCYQFEVVHSQTGPSFKEVGGGSEDDGGDEEDEDGGGDTQDVRQQLLLRVFSCRKLTLQSEPWSKDTITINLLDLTWSLEKGRAPHSKSISSQLLCLPCASSPRTGRSCFWSWWGQYFPCCWTGSGWWCRRDKSKSQVLCCTPAPPEQQGCQVGLSELI